MVDFTEIVDESMFVSGFITKNNIKESFKLISSICDNIDDGTQIDRDKNDCLLDDIQKVIDDLILIYGCQEIEKKI